MSSYLLPSAVAQVFDVGVARGDVTADRCDDRPFPKLAGARPDRGTPEEHALAKTPQNAQNSARRCAKDFPANPAICGDSNLHGKEGVAGSSPAEGSRTPGHSAVFLFRSGPDDHFRPLLTRRVKQGRQW